ncbi:MAG: T9SS type A sorting domain-containing protein [Ignavibacteriae bacterium]|nr:T9SS type A sorting domain-containing protein [Ignavibacteriota bacterium]
MKNILLILLCFVSFNGITQVESCAFSDGNYHYFVWLIDSVPQDFDKQDFINYLEANSNISNSDINFLQQNLVEVYRSLPYLESDPANKILRIVAIDPTLNTFLTPLSESIHQTSQYCDCLNSDGYFHFYVRLIIDEWPPLDFDKTDFINHIQINSNPSNSDLVFLESSINEVYVASPSSQTDNRKTLIVTSDYDLMMPYLYNFFESLNLVELICGEPLLSTNVYQDLTDLILIYPIPVVETSIISLRDQLNSIELVVYDVTGKTLINKSYKDEKVIKMSDFNLISGLYFLKFSNENESIIKKIIVK